MEISVAASEDDFNTSVTIDVGDGETSKTVQTIREYKWKTKALKFIST